MGRLIQQPIRLLIAESQEIFRIGLRSVMESHQSLQIVAEANCVEDLYKLVAKHNPDVILLDLLVSTTNFNELIPNLNQIIPRLIELCPQTRVLALSCMNDEQTHLEVLRAGAVGISAKNQSPELLVKAINAVGSGQLWFDHQITRLLWQTQVDQQLTNGVDGYKAKQASLTERELSIARLASQGFSAKIIGKKLTISEKTVRNQLTIIYEKLGVVSQVELCLKANELGF